MGFRVPGLGFIFLRKPPQQGGLWEAPGQQLLQQDAELLGGRAEVHDHQQGLTILRFDSGLGVGV